MEAFFSSAGSMLITLIASVFVFGLVVFIHELGHFIAAKCSGITVQEFAIGMGPKLFGFERGGTTYAIRLLPIGGFVSMEGEDEESDSEGSFTRAPLWRRMIVVAAGAVMNFLLGFVLLVVLVASQNYIVTRTVGEFYPDATTQQSGLQINDTILAVNGRRCYVYTDILYELVRVQDGVADLTVLRDGQRVELKDVVFDTYEVDGQTYTTQDFKWYAVHTTFWSTLKEAGLEAISMARAIWVSLIDLVTGRLPLTTVSGPIGIVSTIGEATSMGLEMLVWLMAMLTINLGVMNLLPIPALDGGRLVLLVVEAVRRKPLPQKYEIAINAAGFVLLIGIMLFATFNDVTKLIA
jgi:regulator of sigma E protease